MKNQTKHREKLQIATENLTLRKYKNASKSIHRKPKGQLLEWGVCPNGLSFPRAHGWGLNDIEKLLSCLVVVVVALRPPPATHPSQVQTNSANCFYITNRRPRPTHRKIRTIELKMRIVLFLIKEITILIFYGKNLNFVIF